MGSAIGHCAPVLIAGAALPSNLLPINLLFFQTSNLLTHHMARRCLLESNPRSLPSPTFLRGQSSKSSLDAYPCFDPLGLPIGQMPSGLG